MRRSLIRLATTLALALAASSLTAAAAPTKPGKPPKAKAEKPAKLDMERYRRVLDTGSEAEMLGALSELAALGKSAAAAAPLIDGLLGRGANSGVLLAALETEGQLGAPTSSDAVAPYVSHRKPEIRRAAALALGSTGGASAVTALRRALSGPDSAVRGVAATGLGTLGAKEAVDDLFTVLSHDTPQAALSIALLCAPEQCDRLMALVGKLKFEVLEGAFVPLLLRPSGELPDANKLRYIERLRVLATRPAAAVLQSTLTRLPKDESPALRAAIQTALKARPIVGDTK
ncbi:MAG: HEAT repeat domain-containing protein [Polyangiaceae bacterium]